MLRIVIGKSGNDFDVYRGDRILGEIHRSIRAPKAAIWRWRVCSACDVTGEERSLRRTLDAIERAYRRHVH